MFNQNNDTDKVAFKYLIDDVRYIHSFETYILKMKKELYSHFIYINSFFKTSELKISTSGYLEVNELSALGSTQQKIDLTDGNLGIKITKPKNYFNFFIPMLLLGSLFTSFFQIILTNNQALLLTLISSSLLLMSCALLFVNYKSRNTYSLYNLSNNNVVFQISLTTGLSSKNEIREFTDEITSRISKDEYLESLHTTTQNQNSTEEQYNNLIYNLECLYNSGVVDDITFDRIDSNINEKIYPNDYEKEKHSAEVIYLHNF